MITLSLMLVVFLIGLVIFVVGLICCLLSMWMLFRKSDYDFVASRKDPKDKVKKNPSKKPSVNPAKMLRAKK